MYKRCGIDPTRTRPSSEALLRRVRKGDPLPRVNGLVDIINWCSAETQISFGLYDLDKVEPPVTLRLGDSGEGYDGIRKDRVNVDGRLTLADARGPFGNPTSDSARTMSTPETRDVLVLLYVPSGDVARPWRTCARDHARPSGRIRRWRGSHGVPPGLSPPFARRCHREPLPDPEPRTPNPESRTPNPDSRFPTQYPKCNIRTVARSTPIQARRECHDREARDRRPRATQQRRRVAQTLEPGRHEQRRRRSERQHVARCPVHHHVGLRHEVDANPRGQTDAHAHATDRQRIHGGQGLRGPGSWVGPALRAGRLASAGARRMRRQAASDVPIAPQQARTTSQTDAAA